MKKKDAEDEDMDSFFEGLGIGRTSTPPPTALRPDAMQHRSPKNMLRSVDAKKRVPQPTTSGSSQRSEPDLVAPKDDFQSWLDGKQEPHSGERAAAPAKRATPAVNAPAAKGAPPAVPGPLNLPELPELAASDRARAWEDACNVADEDDEEELDSDAARLVTSVVGADMARRMMASMRKMWGDVYAPAGAPSQRTQALVKALLAFQDPKLYLHLHSVAPDTFASPALYSFYMASPPVLELWDAAVLGGVEGFETPHQGRLFFAVGVVMAARQDLLVTQDVGAAVAAACAEAARDPRPAMSIGSRASNHLPAMALKACSEAEIEWAPYVTQVAALPHMPRRSPPVPAAAKVVVVTGATKKPVAGSFPRPPPESAKAAVASWWGGASANLSSTATVWGAKLAEATAQASQQLSKTLLEVAEVATQSAQPQSPKQQPGADEATADGGERTLYLCKYPGKRRLGLQLVQSRHGLSVSGFDRGDALMPGEAEEDGTVIVGDVVHAVNGASVVLLPPSVAGRVIAKQERPLFVTFSTTGSPPVPRLPADLVRVQRQLLSHRVQSFYALHGPNKVDKVSDILDLYAGHEPALLRGLAFKYGEHVPGDDAFAPSFCFIAARDVVPVLTRKRVDDDDVIVDCRSVEERAQTGVFPHSFRAGPGDKAEAWEAIVRALKTRTGLTRYVRVCVMASGKDHIYALADPARSEQCARDDMARVREVVSELAQRGICFVCVVKGGFAECVRECAVRGVAPGVEGGLGDAYQRACEAYSQVDFENTSSVARFLDAHVKNFEPPRDDDDLDPLNVTPALSKLASSIPPVSVNLNPLNLSLPPAGKFSLASIGLGRSSSGGDAPPPPPLSTPAPAPGAEVKLDTAAAQLAVAAAAADDIVSPRTQEKLHFSKAFSIDDDLI